MVNAIIQFRANRKITNSATYTYTIQLNKKNTMINEFKQLKIVNLIGNTITFYSEKERKVIKSNGVIYF